MKIKILRMYLLFLALFTLFWWPLSHWFYPDWYHTLLGFKSYDYSLVKIIGTIGVVPVLGMFFAANDPIRNRDFVISLLVFFPTLAMTYIYLISAHEFPEREYINVSLLVVNTGVLWLLYPWKEAQPCGQPDAAR
ncbi:MAG: hypothetical protein A2V83_03390 [Nitrospirae bacterium RBG_16_64_22]|nr:MAG: hypothetical protein A2V83_03390 [Nitrospirae bacterium RBG_16_64_22]